MEDSGSYPTRWFTGHQSTPTEVSGKSPERKREFSTSNEMWRRILIAKRDLSVGKYQGPSRQWVNETVPYCLSWNLFQCQGRNPIFDKQDLIIIVTSNSSVFPESFHWAYPVLSMSFILGQDNLSLGLQSPVHEKPIWSYTSHHLYD